MEPSLIVGPKKFGSERKNMARKRSECEEMMAWIGSGRYWPERSDLLLGQSGDRNHDKWWFCVGIGAAFLGMCGRRGGIIISGSF